MSGRADGEMSEQLQRARLLALDIQAKLYQLRTADALLDPRDERPDSQIHARMEALITELLAALRAAAETRERQ